MTWKERVPRALWYYGRLFRALPGLVIGASDTVGRVAGVALVLAVVAGASAGLIVLTEWRLWIVVALGVIVLAGLARLNYEEIERRDEQLRRATKAEILLRQEKLEEIVDSIFQDSVQHYAKELREVLNVVDRPAAEQPVSATMIDEWDRNVAGLLLPWMNENERSEFTRPINDGLLVGDWRERYRILIRTREARLDDALRRVTARWHTEREERTKKAERASQ